MSYLFPDIQVTLIFEEYSAIETGFEMEGLEL